MNKKLRALVATTLLASSPAWAVNLVLEGDYVKIGVNELTGTLGSGGNTPPGILYDATGTGTFNSAYDYLTPGSPFEGWALKYNTTTVYNNNTGVRGLTGGVLTGYDGVAYNGSTYDNRAVWTASHTDFDILHDYRFNNNQQFVDISTEVTAKTTMNNLYFGRFTDPDARAAAGDSSATDNVIGYGAIPATNVVFSEAIASRYALGLYTSATNSGAAVSAGWSTDPVVYHTGGTSYGTGVNFGRGDHTIGLGFYLPTLATGSTATFSYAYIFGPSAFGAASTAVTDGAGGGTPGVVPGGGTLVDVGSATSAASSTPSTPTVTGTSTTNIVTTAVTNSPWVLTTLAPVYAYATTSRPTPTIVDDRLVVSRVNTTTTSITDVQTRTVTTTVTTTPQTTTTYSDSTSTVTTGTATSTATTATETGSLTVSTPVGVTQTASAPTDTIDNAMLLNIYSQEMNRADPLSRINIHGDVITKRNTSQATDIARNSWMWVTGKAANGNSDRSNGFEIGAERLVNDTTLVGAQYNRINSTMTGVESGSGRFDTNMINVYAVKKLGSWAVKPTVGYSNSAYDTARTITLGALDNFAAETYANRFSTNGKSYWADLQVIAPKVWKITPYAGLTVRKITVDGGVESGTTHTQLNYSNFNDTSSQPYVGARFDSATTDRGLFYSLDGRVTKFNLADTYKYGETLTTVNSLVGYKINDRSQITVGYQYQHADQYNNGIIGIGGKIDF